MNKTNLRNMGKTTQKGTAYRIYRRPYSPNITNKLKFKLQRTANAYAAERRIYRDLISKNTQSGHIEVCKGGRTT